MFKTQLKEICLFVHLQKKSSQNAEEVKRLDILGGRWRAPVFQKLGDAAPASGSLASHRPDHTCARFIGGIDPDEWVVSDETSKHFLFFYGATL